MTNRTEGIWVSPTEFISFSDNASERAGLLTELNGSGILGGFDPASWFGILPDPDPVLQKTGDGIMALRALTSDDKVLSCIQNRKLGTLKKRDFAFTPGTKKGLEASPDAVRICEALEKDLENVDLYNIMSQMLDAPYYGTAFSELIWEPSGGSLRLKEIKPRPAEWFGFDGFHRPVLRNNENEPIQFGKLVMARHFHDAVNPYGLRLLSRCFWPVAIKKGGIKFWTILCERFGIPWVIGKVNGDEKARRAAVSQLTSMVQNAVAVVSSNTEVEINTLDNKGGNIHSDLIRMCDTAIARVLHGQSITNEGGKTGTFAESKTSFDALGDFREADEHLIITFWQELAWIYTKINAPEGTLSPTFKYIDPEDYESRAKIDEAVSKTGAKFTKVYYTRNYGYKDDEIEVGTPVEEKPAKEEKPEEKPSKEPGSDFSTRNEDAGFQEQDDPDQIAIDEMLDGLIPEAANAHGIAKAISEIISQAESFEDLEARLEQVLPELMGAEGMEDVLTRAMAAADLWGRFTAGRE
ncbi:phage portal protein family protein [Desulforegula conservatrix]|uniref:phage portal protein family protein n=1 Tax=Desulforegula conservatrix TaxID=153026 RepID=UPI00041F6A1D|nr:DUF935 family protein [Desulforegula conservatrix]